MLAIDLRFLGSFEVICSGVLVTHVRGDKVRALLAYLAIEADHPHAHAALAALLWAEQPDELALRNLSQALVRLRQALGDDGALLLSSRHAIQWRRAAVSADVQDFACLARGANPVDDPRAISVA
jgi:DNA-binding SARP family transcriptional activator